MCLFEKIHLINIHGTTFDENSIHGKLFQRKYITSTKSKTIFYQHLPNQFFYNGNLLLYASSYQGNNDNLESRIHYLYSKPLMRLNQKTGGNTDPEDRM